MFPLRCVSSSVATQVKLFSRLIDLARLNRVKQPYNTRSGGKNYTYNVTHARMSCNQYSGPDSIFSPSIRHTNTEKRERKKNIGHISDRCTVYDLRLSYNENKHPEVVVECRAILSPTEARYDPC